MNHWIYQMNFKSITLDSRLKFLRAYFYISSHFLIVQFLNSGIKVLIQNEHKMLWAAYPDDRCASGIQVNLCHRLLWSSKARQSHHTSCCFVSWAIAHPSPMSWITFIKCCVSSPIFYTLHGFLRIGTCNLQWSRTSQILVWMKKGPRATPDKLGEACTVCLTNLEMERNHIG